MFGSIEAIEYHLPPKTLTTQTLSKMFPEWSVEKIDAKTGISERHVASEFECASDLGVAAAEKLFASGRCAPQQIDFLLFCSQSPDFVLPTTACLIQRRLGIPMGSGALDFNLGCSGFVYGLGIAEGLIQSRQAQNVLLITAETYSKYLSTTDKASRTIFGDGAAATFLRSANATQMNIGPFIYGTDGTGQSSLIVPGTGARKIAHPLTSSEVHGNDPLEGYLRMDGPKVFEFALKRVPDCVFALLRQARLEIDDIALFIFHQANAFLLEELRSIMRIPKERFQISLAHCANTVSSTIPIALKDALLEGRLKYGDKVLLVGFGVGYSWAATIVRWTAS